MIGLIFVLVEHVPMFNPCQIRGLIFGIENRELKFVRDRTPPDQGLIADEFAIDIFQELIFVLVEHRL
jgi:hypothetical protein